MHKAKNVIITCMDFRFQKKIQNYLLENGYLGESDEIIVAGAGRDLIKPVTEADGEYLWKQLSLSMKLHNPDNIIIIEHQDCGGWAQDKTIPSGLSNDDDRDSHQIYCQKLQKKIADEYPDKKIKFLYAELNGKIGEMEE
jgi:hypothetical protein